MTLKDLTAKVPKPKILAEFKKFLFRGNVLDLAVGFIMGRTFDKLVTSMVENVIMPPIGYLIGHTDFTNLKIVMESGAKGEEAAIKYGAFIQDTVDFILIAFCVFLLISLVGKVRRGLGQKEKEVNNRPPQEVLLTEIRDILKSKRDV